VQYHLVLPFFGRRHHGDEPVLLKPKIGIEGIHCFAGITDDEEDFGIWHGFQFKHDSRNWVVRYSSEKQQSLE